jgi:hypothetical protein
MTGEIDDFLAQQDAEAIASPHEGKTNDGGVGAGNGHDSGWTTTLPEHPWPAPLGDNAYHGLAGDFVRLISPHTEADVVSLLTQFLCMIGNCIGRKVYYPVGARGTAEI